MARPRDPSIDRAVVDACVELLEEVGRHRLSREQIARRAGVSLPAVNRRFSSVDDVLVAVASSPMSDTPPPAATSLRSYLAESLTRMARVFAAVPIRRSASELLAAAAGDERIARAFEASLARQRSIGLGWISEARERGEIREDVDPEILLDLVFGAPYYRLLWRGEAIDEGDAAAIVDLVLAGAQPPGNGSPGETDAGRRGGR